MSEIDKNEKILNLIEDLRKLNDGQLDVVIDCVQSSLKVQYLLGLNQNKMNPCIKTE